NVRRRLPVAVDRVVLAYPSAVQTIIRETVKSRLGKGDGLSSVQRPRSPVSLRGTPQKPPRIGPGHGLQRMQAARILTQLDNSASAARRSLDRSRRRSFMGRHAEMSDEVFDDLSATEDSLLQSAIADRLRAAGLRPTRQRVALGMLLFGEEDRHVSAEILHAEALMAGEQVSLATVYNTLHQFTGAGLLRELA